MPTGKQWEQRLKEDWLRSFPNTFLLRLPDQQSGYKGSINPSDFIAYNRSCLFLIEAKATKANTFSVNFRQYDSLVQYADMEGVKPGVMIWFYSHDKVVWVPIQTFIHLREQGKKSFNITKPEGDYVIIPSKKKRVYLECDFRVL